MLLMVEMNKIGRDGVKLKADDADQHSRNDSVEGQVGPMNRLEAR
jgi:hypothetical protein